MKSPTYGVDTVGVVISIRRINAVGSLNIFVLKMILEVTDTHTDLTLVTLWLMRSKFVKIWVVGEF